MVTGAVSDEFAVNCLKRGADDYVLKSSLTKLPSVIENTLKQKETEWAKNKASKDLARRNEELSRINRELDSFVYSVSHNLRAPLRSVLGLLHLAKNEKDPNLLEKYHKMMESSILKLDDSLKDILEYSRSLRQTIKIQKVDLKKIIDDNLEKMQFMPGFDRLVTEVLVNEHPFYSDEYRLSVIFNNLISNSIKYLDKSKVSSFIKISTNVTDDSAVIEFQDNGIGIEKDMLPKIFDMFFRATGKKEGAGLGLYIVREEAIEMLHGKIEVDSNLGEGTHFHIEIPNRIKKDQSTSMNTYLVDRG